MDRGCGENVGELRATRKRTIFSPRFYSDILAILEDGLGFAKRWRKKKEEHCSESILFSVLELFSAIHPS